jgi:hypothetical protein
LAQLNIKPLPNPLLVGEGKGINLGTGEALTPPSLPGKGVGGLGLYYIF